MGKFSISHRHVTHEMNVPGRKRSNGVVKTIKFYRNFLCSDFSKNYSSQRGGRDVIKLILRLPLN